MDDQIKSMIKKDIFVAVISNGSMVQKEHWQDTCENAMKWVLKSDTPVKVQTRRTKKK